MTLGLLLVVAALALAAYNLFEDRRAGESSALVVERLAVSDTAYEAVGGEDAGGASDAGALAAQAISPETPMPTEAVDGSLYIGTLRIPSLGLELPIMSEWSDEGLRTAPCRYAGSAYSDDLVIAGHSYASHFGGLGSVSYGAEVIFSDVRGNVFAYEVASIEEIGAYEVEAMTESGWDLTLFTCTFDGSDRVAVRCKELVPEV